MTEALDRIPAGRGYRIHAMTFLLLMIRDIVSFL